MRINKFTVFQIVVGLFGMGGMVFIFDSGNRLLLSMPGAVPASVLAVLFLGTAFALVCLEDTKTKREKEQRRKATIQRQSAFLVAVLKQSGVDLSDSIMDMVERGLRSKDRMFFKPLVDEFLRPRAKALEQAYAHEEKALEIRDMTNLRLIQQNYIPKARRHFYAEGLDIAQELGLAPKKDVRFRDYLNESEFPKLESATA